MCAEFYIDEGVLGLIETWPIFVLVLNYNTVLSIKCTLAGSYNFIVNKLRNELNVRVLNIYLVSFIIAKLLCFKISVSVLTFCHKNHG
jgi:hypothetical protein